MVYSQKGKSRESQVQQQLRVQKSNTAVTPYILLSVNKLWCSASKIMLNLIESCVSAHKNKHAAPHLAALLNRQQGKKANVQRHTDNLATKH